MIFINVTFDIQFANSAEPDKKAPTRALSESCLHYLQFMKYATRKPFPDTEVLV